MIFLLLLLYASLCAENESFKEKYAHLTKVNEEAFKELPPVKGEPKEGNMEFQYKFKITGRKSVKQAIIKANSKDA